MKSWGERWSFIWLVIITIDLVGGALLMAAALKKPEPISIEVEHFESGSYTMPEQKSQRHVEELETGVLINNKDLEILARIINGESGSDWCSDKMQLYVGSVFLNRVKSQHFPNTFEEVAFQQGQYSCTHPGGGYWKEPNERAYANAELLLREGSQLEGYLFQANFEQGRDTIKVQNMYFGKK